MSKTIEEIRTRIDAIDDSLHDLLMERAALAVEIGAEKRKTQDVIVHPEREARLVRRLLARHKGPLPEEAVVRLWRELVGAVSLLQSPLKVVVSVPEGPQALTYWGLAKDYFSSVLPMQKAGNALQALSMLREGEVSFAVLPWPVDGDSNPWWGFLMSESGEPPMRIMARLPYATRPDTLLDPAQQALVVARTRFAPSDNDHSFIALMLEQNVSRARLVEQSRALGMEALSIQSRASRDALHTIHFMEVKSYVGDDDSRLSQLLAKLDNPEGKALSLGGYAVVAVKGKTAESAKTAPAGGKATSGSAKG